MRRDLLQLVFLSTVLVIGGTVEELVPKAYHVGLPVLMSAAMCVAVTKHPIVATLFAISAGAFEDSLSGLPVLTSVSFFLVVTILARWSRFPKVALVLAYSAYQAWLALLVPGLHGNVWSRILMAVPYGAAAAFSVGLAIVIAERGAALDQT